MQWKPDILGPIQSKLNKSKSYIKTATATPHNSIHIFDIDIARIKRLHTTNAPRSITHRARLHDEARFDGRTTGVKESGGYMNMVWLHGAETSARYGWRVAQHTHDLFGAHAVMRPEQDIQTYTHAFLFHPIFNRFDCRRMSVLSFFRFGHRLQRKCKHWRAYETRHPFHTCTFYSIFFFCLLFVCFVLFVSFPSDSRLGFVLCVLHAWD